MPAVTPHSILKWYTRSCWLLQALQSQHNTITDECAGLKIDFIAAPCKYSGTQFGTPSYLLWYVLLTKHKRWMSVVMCGRMIHLFLLHLFLYQGCNCSGMFRAQQVSAKKSSIEFAIKQKLLIWPDGWLFTSVWKKKQHISDCNHSQPSPVH